MLFPSLPPSRQTHFDVVHSPKFANLLMLHYMYVHKTPILHFYDFPEFRFCLYCKILQCRISAYLIRQFFRMVHCICCSSIMPPQDLLSENMMPSTQEALRLQRDRATRLSVQILPTHYAGYTALSIASCGKNRPYCTAHQV